MTFIKLGFMFQIAKESPKGSAIITHGCAHTYALGLEGLLSTDLKNLDFRIIKVNELEPVKKIYDIMKSTDWGRIHPVELAETIAFCHRNENLFLKDFNDNHYLNERYKAPGEELSKLATDARCARWDEEDEATHLSRINVLPCHLREMMNALHWKDLRADSSIQAYDQKEIRTRWDFSEEAIHAVKDIYDAREDEKPLMVDKILDVDDIVWLINTNTNLASIGLIECHQFFENLTESMHLVEMVSNKEKVREAISNGVKLAEKLFDELFCGEDTSKNECARKMFDSDIANIVYFENGARGRNLFARDLVSSSPRVLLIVESVTILRMDMQVGSNLYNFLSAAVLNALRESGVNSKDFNTKEDGNSYTDLALKWIVSSKHSCPEIQLAVRNSAIALSKTSKYRDVKALFDKALQIAG